MKPFLSTILLHIFGIFLLVTYASADTAVVDCGGGFDNKKCPYGPKIVSKNDRYGVRCCSKTEFYPYSRKQSGCRVWGGTITNIPGPGVEEGGAAGLYCPWSLTYAEAELHCANLGARICTEQELGFRCAKSTGCHLNWEYVWTYAPIESNLNQQECYTLPDAGLFNPGGFTTTSEDLPYGCQLYFDPSAPEYNRVIYNLANEDEKPFPNLEDEPNAHCTSGSCVGSYSVMQVWLSGDGTLTEEECAELPDASESNEGGFIVRYTEIPYGCQMLFNPKEPEEDRVVFNRANKGAEPFANIIDSPNAHCTVSSGWCLRSYSVMQVWTAAEE